MMPGAWSTSKSEPGSATLTAAVTSPTSRLVEEVQPARPEHPRRLGDDPVEVAHVLEYVAARHEIERGIRERELLTGADEVLDAETALPRVGTGRLDRRPATDRCPSLRTPRPRAPRR